MKSGKRKRCGISSKTRWEIFRRDGFKCIYCGSVDELVIDHVDPFAHGGSDSKDNFATACRKCNAGKRDQRLVPPLAADSGFESERAVRCDGVDYRNHLHRDWSQALQHVSHFSVVEYCQKGKKTYASAGDTVPCDFDLLARFSSRARLMNVVIAPLCDNYSEGQQKRVRNAVLAGMSHTPTILLIGSPFYFYGAVVDGSCDNLAAGWALDDRMRFSRKMRLADCHSSELGDFVDPRDAFSLRANSFPWREVMDEMFDASQAFRDCLIEEASCP